MHFLTATISALLATSATAFPLSSLLSHLRPRQSQQLYTFRTSISPANSTKDGLYVYSSHTGAGLGAAALTPNATIADQGAINETSSELGFVIGDIGVWPMSFEYVAYGRWAPVDISIASEGTPGFSLDPETNFVTNNQTAGWLACDWWYDQVQLFYLPLSYENVETTIPSSCSLVNLEAVPV